MYLMPQAMQHKVEDQQKVNKTKLLAIVMQLSNSSMKQKKKKKKNIV